MTGSDIVVKALVDHGVEVISPTPALQYAAAPVLSLSTG